MVKFESKGLLLNGNERQRELIEKALRGGKRKFGSSGASLTHQISNPKYRGAGIDASLAKIGLSGEHSTSRQLIEWAKDKPNVVLVDSVHVKGYGKEELDEDTGTLEGGDTDHIIIVGSFVVLVDSKNWKGKRKYSVAANGEILRTGKSFPGGKIRSKGALYLWQSYLGPFSPKIMSLITITSEKVFVVRDRNWWKQRFKVVTSEELTDFLDKIWGEIPDSEKDKVNIDLVTAIVVNAIRPYNAMKEALGDTYKLLER